MNVLLATDGSEASLSAVRGLLQRVRWFREALQVHVVFVHPPVPHGLVRSFISRDVIEDYYREEGEKAVAPASTILTQANIAHTKHLLTGDAPPTIVRMARELACELIWMGTHGHGAAASLALGSVARKVLQLADLPVLLIR
jgi:nucleotide-binding universal stress UspA family protein